MATENRAFVLVVSERHAHVGLLASIDVDSHSGVECDIGKVAIAIVTVEVIGLSIVGYKQIQESVVIEVAPDRCQPEELLWVIDTGGFGYLGEGSVAIVVVEGVGRSFKTAGTALHCECRDTGKLAWSRIQAGL